MLRQSVPADIMNSLAGMDFSRIFKKSSCYNVIPQMMISLQISIIPADYKAEERQLPYGVSPLGLPIFYWPVNPYFPFTRWRTFSSGPPPSQRNAALAAPCIQSIGKPEAR